MKFVVVFAFILIAVVAFKPIQSARVCVIRVNNCRTNIPVCGVYGRSNLCMKFQNECFLEAANCSDDIGYTSVNATRCNGIAVNARRACAGLSSSTPTASGIFSNLFGTNNNVRPIVINTG